jgi:topoisomerase IA-like protein
MQAVSAQISEGKCTVGAPFTKRLSTTPILTTVSNLQSASDEVKLTLDDARKIINDVNAGKGRSANW